MLRRRVAPVAVALAVLAAAAPPAAAPPGPLDVTREFYRALNAGDARAAARLVTAPDAEPVLRSFVRVSGSYRDLEAALAKRFGEDAAGLVGYGRKAQEELKALLGATVEIEGDTARIAAVDGQTITTLRNVRGAWRIELEEVLETPEGRAAFAAHANATEAASKHVVGRVRRGKYHSARDAVDDFEARLARAAADRRAEPPARPVPELEGVPL